MSEWLPIKSAPLGVGVLTVRVVPGEASFWNGKIQVAWKYDGWATWSENWPAYSQPTHWMPLPSPPKEPEYTPDTLPSKSEH